MNPKITLLALGLAITPMATAQVNLELPSSYVNTTTSGGLNTLPPNVEGSPYLTENFVQGTVFIEDEKPYPAMMRYNAYQDEIQVRGSQGLSSLFKRDYVWAVIGPHTFRIEEYERKSQTTQGYFIELNRGDLRLLKRITHVFREAEEAASSYSQGKPPRFEEEVSYYLIKEGGPAREVRLRKKDILGFLSSKEAESYVKENKFRLKSESEVTKLLMHLNAG